jgi:hypothetical protein
MGYFIDLVFDSAEVSDRQAVVSLLFQAGAYAPEEDEILDLPEITEEDWDWIEWKHERNWLIPIHGKAQFCLFQTIRVALFDRESSSMPGYWAHVRLSWGTKPRQFQEILTTLVEFSQKAHCRVYDGQIGQFVTFANLEIIVEGFRHTKHRVIKMLGAT